MKRTIFGQLENDLDDLVVRTFELAGPPEKLPVLYQMALILEARTLFSSGLFLVRHDKTDAAWLCLRSLAEIVIKMKWMGSSFSRFCCLAIGEEIAAEKRLRGERRRRRLKDQVLQNVNDRLGSFLESVPKRGPYWDRRKKRFKKPPTLMEMARQADAWSIYSAEFRYASLYVHSSNRVIHRFVKQDEKSERFTFSVTPDPEEQISPEWSLLSLYFLAAGIASKAGFPIDEPSLKRLHKQFEAPEMKK